MTYDSALEEVTYAPMSPMEVDELRADFPLFCATQLKIDPKVKELVKARSDSPDEEIASGPLIPFIWNNAQKEVWRVIRQAIRKEHPQRYAVLKARQVGISTFFCAYMFWCMWRAMHIRAAVCAFQDKTTLSELNTTMRIFYENLHPDIKPTLRTPGKGKTLALHEHWFDDRKSRCKYVVQKPGAGRGIASDLALFTEVSFYKDPEEFFGGFWPTLSDGSATLAVLESTAEDGFFKDQYEDYKTDAGFRRAIFIAWWQCEDLYSRALIRRGKKLFDAQVKDYEVHLPPSIRKMQRELTALARGIGHPDITDEQMWWWLHYCETKYEGDEEWMLQEFPNDDVTAFRRKSRSAFRICLEVAQKTSAETEEVYPDAPGAGLLHSATYKDWSRETQEVIFEGEHREGFIDGERRPGWYILEFPVEGRTYVLGGDVADDEGEDDEEGERAFSTLRIYCCDTREEVAWFRGHIDPSDLGDEAVKGGYLYNTALLNIERNNMGRLTEHRIKNELRYPLSKLYKWPDLNTGLEKLTTKTFWESNVSSKAMAIGSFRNWVREGLYVIRDPMLVYEMDHYMVVKGQFAARGAPADRIISACMVVMAVEQTPFAYRNIVMGSPGIERENRSARGAAARVLRTTKVPRLDLSEVPEELEGLGTLRMTDVWESTFGSVFDDPQVRAADVLRSMR